MYGGKTKKLTFGIDFDDTITKHPEMFSKIINTMIDYGCDIYIVTARQQSGWCEKLRAFHLATGIDVIFTGATAKHDVVDIDIWIDDFPLAITHDFRETGWSPSASIKKDIK